MSNEQTLQQYNEQLENNNNSLDNILEIINELPEAGEDVGEEVNSYGEEIEEQGNIVDELVYTLKNRVINAGAQNNYSTEEQLIGTWIDNKPLYRKTLVKTSETAVTYLNLGSINDVDYINVINGCTQFTNGVQTYYVPTSTYETSTNFSKFYIQKTSANIAHINWTGNSTSGTIYAIVEYTKTTD